MFSFYELRYASIHQSLMPVLDPPQSFPILLTISLYERYVITHSSVRESAQLFAQSIYGSLPRPVRSLPFFEALMGTNLNDVYEAIFEAGPDVIEEDEELFADREQDHIGLHSWNSRERGRNGTHTPPHTSMPELHIPESPARASRRASSIPRPQPGQSSSSPLTRKLSLRPSLAEPLRASAAAGAQGLGPHSPLSRLFGARRSDVDGGPSPVDVQKLDKVEEGVRRVQELLEDVRELPVARLKEEMRELQERQTRIEGLLLMLTRGMRNEAGSAAAPSRHDTL
jgi:hypothetical protein